MRPSPSPSPQPVGFHWHTALLLVLLIAGALLPKPQSAPASLSLATLAVQAVLMAFLWIGLLPPRRETLRALWGETRHPLRSAALALSVAAVVVFATRTLGDAAPFRSGVDRAAWLPVACVVAFVEELTFRGYLQRQLEAWRLPGPVAALLQACAFALLHANQPLKAQAAAAGFALVLTALAKTQRGLFAPFCAHALVDLSAAFSP